MLLCPPTPPDGAPTVENPSRLDWCEGCRAKRGSFCEYYQTHRSEVVDKFCWACNKKADAKQNPPVPERYFLRCKDCLSVTVVVADREPAGHVCGACGGMVESLGAVRQEHLWHPEFRVPCDARCTSATGPNCNCMCKGENHGSNRIVEVQVDTGTVPTVTPKNIEQAKQWADEYRTAKGLVDAAIKTKYGRAMARKEAGEHIPDDEFYGMRWAYERFNKAKKLRSHKGRLKALADLVASLEKPETVENPLNKQEIGEIESLRDSFLEEMDDIDMSQPEEFRRHYYLRGKAEMAHDITETYDGQRNLPAEMGKSIEKLENPPAVPQVGDEVYTYYGGFMGTPTVAHGVVVLRRGTPTVQITKITAMIGGARPPAPREKFRSLTPDWTKKGEEHPSDRRMRESEERRKAEAERARLQELERQKQIDAIRAQGGQYLDQVTPEVGMKLKNVMTGETGTIRQVQTFSGEPHPTAFVVWDTEPEYGARSIGFGGREHLIVGKETLEEIAAWIAARKAEQDAYQAEEQRQALENPPEPNFKVGDTVQYTVEIREYGNTRPFGKIRRVLPPDETHPQYRYNLVLEGRRRQVQADEKHLALISRAEDARKPEPRGPIGTCQVCFHKQRTNGVTLVLHGYHRPGHGYIIGRCTGTNYPPFEVSCEETKKFIGVLQDYHVGRVEHLRKLNAEEYETLYFKPYSSAWGPKKPDVAVSRGADWQGIRNGMNSIPSYAELKARNIQQTESEIRYVLADIKTYQTAVDEWKPVAWPPVVEAENPPKLPAVLYHGTTMERLEKIRKDGLIVSRPELMGKYTSEVGFGSDIGNVSLAVREKDAIMFSSMANDIYMVPGGLPAPMALIRIDTSKLDESKITFSSLFGKRNAEVKYWGNIPPEAIADVKIRTFTWQGEGKSRHFKVMHVIQDRHGAQIGEAVAENPPEQTDEAFAADFASKVAAKGGKAYIIGGWVRDRLMAFESKDMDIEVFGLPQPVLEALLSEYGEVNLVGKHFGVYKVGDIDIALPRKEIKTGTGHKGFEVSPDPTLSLDDAALRRDLTINAIFYDPLLKVYVDPVGGKRDIETGVLRQVRSDTFVEDPLRVYRVMQFAARFGFSVDPELEKLCTKMVAEGQLAELPKERIFEEFNKMLVKGAQPSLGLKFLWRIGAIEKHFPELHAMIGTPQQPDWHAEGDVWTHALMVLDAGVTNRSTLDNPLAFMYGCLCHDMGKPLVTKLVDGKIKSHEHDTVGVDVARAFMERLTDNALLIEQALYLVRNHQLIGNWYVNKPVKKSTAVKLYKSLKAIGLSHEYISAITLADNFGRVVKGTGTPIEENLEQVKWFNELMSNLTITPDAVKRLDALVTGYDLIDMGLKPGPLFKEILDVAYTFQLDNATADKAQVMQVVKNMVGEQNPVEAENPKTLHIDVSSAGGASRYEQWMGKHAPHAVTQKRKGLYYCAHCDEYLENVDEMVTLTDTVQAKPRDDEAENPPCPTENPPAPKKMLAFGYVPPTLPPADENTVFIASDGSRTNQSVLHIKGKLAPKSGQWGSWHLTTVEDVTMTKNGNLLIKWKGRDTPQAMKYWTYLYLDKFRDIHELARFAGDRLRLNIFYNIDGREYSYLGWDIAKNRPMSVENPRRRRELTSPAQSSMRVALLDARQGLSAARAEGVKDLTAIEQKLSEAQTAAFRGAFVEARKLAIEAETLAYDAIDGIKGNPSVENPQREKYYALKEDGVYSVYAIYKRSASDSQLREAESWLDQYGSNMAREMGSVEEARASASGCHWDFKTAEAANAFGRQLNAKAPPCVIVMRGEKNPTVENPPHIDSYVLWGTKKGDPAWAEQMIVDTKDKNKLKAATEWAKKNGFVNLRVLGLDMSTEPDFFAACGISKAKNPGLEVRKTGRYIRERQKDPKLFDKDTLRTKPGPRGHKFIIGKLKGKDTTEIQSILHPLSEEKKLEARKGEEVVHKE